MGLRIKTSIITMTLRRLYFSVGKPIYQLFSIVWELRIKISNITLLQDYIFLNLSDFSSHDDWMLISQKCDRKNKYKWRYCRRRRR